MSCPTYLLGARDGRTWQDFVFYHYLLVEGPSALHRRASTIVSGSAGSNYSIGFEFLPEIWNVHSSRVVSNLSSLLESCISRQHKRVPVSR